MTDIIIFFTKTYDVIGAWIKKKNECIHTQPPHIHFGRNINLQCPGNSKSYTKKMVNETSICDVSWMRVTLPCSMSPVVAYRQGQRERERERERKIDLFLKRLKPGLYSGGMSVDCRCDCLFPCYTDMKKVQLWPCRCLRCHGYMGQALHRLWLEPLELRNHDNESNIFNQTPG